MSCSVEEHVPVTPLLPRAPEHTAVRQKLGGKRGVLRQLAGGWGATTGHVPLPTQGSSPLPSRLWPRRGPRRIGANCFLPRHWVFHESRSMSFKTLKNETLPIMIMILLSGILIYASGCKRGETSNLVHSEIMGNIGYHFHKLILKNLY